MALIQQVKDGKFIDETTGTGSTSTKSSEKDKKTNELGYDQFLQIICRRGLDRTLHTKL